MLLNERNKRREIKYSDNVKNYQFEVPKDKDFTHTNMTPHFRGTPNMVFDHQYDAKLEQMQGDGQVRSMFFKTEQEPLFENHHLRDPNRNSEYDNFINSKKAILGDYPHLLHQNERPPGTHIYVGKGLDPFYNDRAFGDLSYELLPRGKDGKISYGYGNCPSYTFWRPDALTYEELTGKTKPNYDITKQVFAGVRPTFHGGLNAVNIRELLNERSFNTSEGMANINGLTGMAMPIRSKQAKKKRDRVMTSEIGNTNCLKTMDANPNIKVNKVGKNNIFPVMFSMRELSRKGTLKSGLPRLVIKKTPLYPSNLGLPTLIKKGPNRNSMYTMHDPLLFPSKQYLNKTTKINNQNLPNILSDKSQIKDYDFRTIANMAGSNVEFIRQKYDPEHIELKLTNKDTLLHIPNTNIDMGKFFYNPELYNPQTQTPKRTDYPMSEITDSNVTGDKMPGIVPGDIILKDARKPMNEFILPGFSRTKGMIIHTDPSLNRFANKKFAISNIGNGGKLISEFSDGTKQYITMPNNKIIVSGTIGQKRREQIGIMNEQIGTNTRSTKKNEINSRII
jgi:hypothetical protein